MAPCAKCDQEHLTLRGGTACAGHISTGPKDQPIKPNAGQPCRNPPMTGQAVCRVHGGSAKRAKRAGQARAAAAAIQADATALLASEGIDGVTDPVAEIGRLAAEALALKKAAGARVNALTDIRYTGGLERDERGELRGTGTEQTRAEVLVYERALDRSMRFLEIVTKHTKSQDVDDTKSMLAQLGKALGIPE